MKYKHKIIDWLEDEPVSIRPVYELINRADYRLFNNEAKRFLKDVNFIEEIMIENIFQYHNGDGDEDTESMEFLSSFAPSYMDMYRECLEMYKNHCEYYLRSGLKNCDINVRYFQEKFAPLEKLDRYVK